MGGGQDHITETATKPIQSRTSHAARNTTAMRPVERSASAWMRYHSSRAQLVTAVTNRSMNGWKSSALLVSNSIRMNNKLSRRKAELESFNDDCAGKTRNHATQWAESECTTTYSSSRQHDIKELRHFSSHDENQLAQHSPNSNFGFPFFRAQLLQSGRDDDAG